MIRNVIAALVLAALIAIGASLWQQLDRPVRAVRVEGLLTPAEQAAIREVVSRSLDDGILGLDVAELRERIRALSWPREVAVRRVWPETLVIRVEKESVVAAWGDGGYLNSAGRVVQLADGVANVPVLAASQSPPRRAMEMYQLLESRLNPLGYSIARLEENALGEWLMTFESGMTVALGNEDLNQRLERFLLAHEEALAGRSDLIEHVDLRYEHGLAVRWTEATPAVGAAFGRDRSDIAAEGRSHNVDSQQSGIDYALR